MSPTLRDQLQATLSGTHTVERELGGGGMSKVFVAEETRLRRKVVVKVLPPELAQGLSVERFEREIRTAAALQQANIVPVLSAGDTNGLPFYVMPYVEGESLRARLDRAPLAINDVVSLMRDVARALAYAHRQGVVHRDIKPDNILLSEGTAVVTDFGIAKAISASRTVAGDATLTQVGTSIGTPAYMAPEQAAGDPAIDHRADIYALGATVYELLTGRVLFADRTPQQMFIAHMAEDPVSVAELRPDTPPPLADLVMRCLAKDAADRPQDAAQILQELENAGGGSVAAMPAVPPDGSGRFIKALAVYAATLVVVAVAAKAAIVGIGLPDWVFPGALIVMALSLPAVRWTGFVRVGVYAMGAFVVMIAAFMGMRAAGIGPFGSLLASGALDARDRVILTDFTASGNDSTLGRVVSDAVRAGLNESSVFTVVAQSEVAAALQRMQRPASSRVDLATAREIAQREGFKAILAGDVALIGGSYIVAVRLVTGDSARELTSARATAPGAQQLIDAADQVARTLRGKAGESLRRVQNAPALARVTTGSIDALRKYGQAVRLNDMERDYRRAIPLLREAVAIDPLFAEAWRKLGVALQNIGSPTAQTDSAFGQAYALRDRLSERERDLITASWFRSGSRRDRAKAIAAYEAMLARGDSDIVALGNLGIELGARREYERAETLARAVQRVQPSSQLANVNVIGVLLLQGKLAAADSAISANRARLPEVAAFRQWAVRSLGDRGRLDEMQDALDSARKDRDPRNPSWALNLSADLALDRGRLREWRSLRAETRQVNAGLGRSVDEFYAAMADLQAMGSARLPLDTERRAFDAALVRFSMDELPVNERPYHALATTFALTARPDRARALLAQQRAEVKDTAVLRQRRPGTDAAESRVAFAEGRWMDAVAAARRGDRLPDGPNGPCSYCLSFELVATFLEAGMADSALAEYEAYRATPFGARKRDGPDLALGASLYEGIAKAYDAGGDAVKAAEHYREFVELWKNADLELQPRVKAAQDRLRLLTPVERPR